MSRCALSSRYNSCASFYSFPVKEEIRKKCIVNIRRINFQITKHTKVCSVHFKPDDFVEGTSRRRLKKGAVPSVFEWNRERQMHVFGNDKSDHRYRNQIWRKTKWKLIVDMQSDMIIVQFRSLQL